MPDNSPPLEYQILDPSRQQIRVVSVQRLRQRYWLHILLCLATLLSTLCIGAKLQDDFSHNVWPFANADYALPWTWALLDWRHRLPLGIPFAACLLGILTAHEFGHYILCRRRGVQATLQYFIPFPSLFGTLGAVIRLRSPIHSRKDLFDIGIAGPIAGFVVAVPILMVSLYYSKPLTIQPGKGWPVLGLPLIFRVVRWAFSVLGVHTAAAKLSSPLYLAPTAVSAWVRLPARRCRRHFKIFAMGIENGGRKGNAHRNRPRARHPHLPQSNERASTSTITFVRGIFSRTTNAISLRNAVLSFSRLAAFTMK